MARAMEDLSDQAEQAAPWEFGDLIHSGHPEVRRGMDVTYDRPPKRHRLSKAELAQKSRWRYAGYPPALKGWIYWHHTIRSRLGIPPRRRGCEPAEAMSHFTSLGWATGETGCPSLPPGRPAFP
jgi:hypothetical protein